MSYAPKPIDLRAAEGARRFMRLTPREQAKMLAEYQRLPLVEPEEMRALRAEVAALKARIRLARDVLNGRRVMKEDDSVIPRDDALAELLDLRTPLPGGRR